MLTIHVLPRRLKEFLLTHPLYKSPRLLGDTFHEMWARANAALSKKTKSLNILQYVQRKPTSWALGGVRPR